MVDNRNGDLLETLKTEIKYIEAGGYQRRLQSEWRAPFIFEDSPTCMNYGVSARAFVACKNCVLMPLVPTEHASVEWPCRHIPLNRAGETLDSLYRSADPLEIEITVRRWLQIQIEHLETERKAQAKDSAEKQPPGVQNSPARDTVRATNA